MRRARIRQRRLVILLRGWHWAQLGLRVYLAGPDLREFLVPRHAAPSLLPHYDFEPDVRELLLEEVRFDVYAEWSDPRDWLGVSLGGR